MNILISGGGTGGHIFPAVSIANEIRRRHPEARILFVGAQGRMEMQRVPKAGYEIIGLSVAGFDRRRLWRNAGVLLKLYKSLRKARRIVRDFKPDIAIGVGGYASGPTLKAAQRRGVPTLLQEQNSYAGVTNKLLAKKARAICVAYKGMERFFPAESIILTGNPIRADILECDLSPQQAREKLGFDPARPLVMVVGGSLGSATLNRTMIDTGASITGRTGAQILWQTGTNYAEGAADCPLAQMPGVKATAFISDMATAYRAADVVVSRAGAGTISELQALGACAILVPSPNVAEDHQRKNAMALVEADAAVMVEDKDAHDKLADTVVALLSDPGRRDEMSKHIKAMALENSASKIVDQIEHIIAR